MYNSLIYLLSGTGIQIHIKQVFDHLDSGMFRKYYLKMFFYFYKIKHLQTRQRSNLEFKKFQIKALKGIYSESRLT